MRVQKLPILLLILLLLEELLVVKYCYTQKEYITIPHDEPFPLDFKRAGTVFSSLSDFALEGDYLYLLYSNVDLMEKYDLNGNYIRSYAFQTRKNGMMKMHINRTGLWVEDKFHQFYHFQNGCCVENSGPLVDEDRRELSRSFSGLMESKYDLDGSRYYIRGASIYKEDTSGNTLPVVVRPFICILLQDTTLFLLNMCFLLALICTIWFSYHRGRRRTAGDD